VPRRSVSKLITEGLVTIFKETGDAVGGTIEFTRHITVDTLRNVRHRKGVVPDVTREAINGAIQAGSHAGSELGSVAKSAVIGVVRGLGEVTRITPAVISEAVKAAIYSTKKVGGDVTIVSQSAVEGAIEAGKEAGMNAEEVASVATRAAVESVEEIDETLAESVIRGLSETISGIKLVLRLPIRRPVIVIVDSNRSSLEPLALQLGKEGYRTLGVSNLDDLDQMIEQRRKITLVLFDLTGLSHDIWERCAQLSLMKIPFLIISPHRSPTVQRESMKYGATGVFTKPLATKELFEHIHTLLGD